MAIYYPQLNNGIVTQTPYGVAQAFETPQETLETGMRWAFALRGAGLTGYPAGPLSRFSINYPNITDAELAVLYAFFQSVKGKWATFRFLDPSGNLLQYSEDFSKSYWANTSTYIYGTGDPFNVSNGYGTQLSAGYVEAVIGPSDGGMSGLVMCASIWISSPFSGTTATIGFLDNTTSTYTSTAFAVPVGSWRRIFKTFVLSTNNQFLFKLVLSNTCYVYGAQVSPTKGESAYSRSPDNYGYHATCRLDVDNFAYSSQGPNQNSLLMPVVEVNT